MNLIAEEEKKKTNARSKDLVAKLTKSLETLRDSYSALMAEKKDLESRVEGKQHELNVAAQGHDEARDALRKNRRMIEKAGEEIGDLRKAGRELRAELETKESKASSAMVFELTKGVAVAGLVGWHAVSRPQGWLWTAAWAALLVWAYIASICRRRTKITENIWFILLLGLSGWLTYTAGHGTRSSVAEAVYMLFATWDSVVGHICVYVLVLMLHSSAVFWHRMFADHNGETRRERDCREALDGKAGIFARTDTFWYVPEENKKGLDRQHNKPAWADGEREARSRSRGYCLVLPGRDALPDDNPVKPVVDTRGEDAENGIVAYNVTAEEWWFLRDWRRTAELLKAKKTTNARSKNDEERGR